jgi:type II secretory pathway pseudopilin PulG
MVPTASFPASHDRRSGITLMEVLISIGILSIGLASVVALIPAGGSQAKKTVIEDRRGAMGAGAIADVVNYGMLNPANWSTIPTSPYRVVIDPIGNGSFPSAAGLAAISVSHIAPGSQVANLIFSAADDLVYVDDPTKADPTTEPPVPKRTSDNARRLSEGGFSWLATLVPSGTASPSQFYTLSVVEFYRRPPSGTALSATVSGVSAGQSNVTIKFGTPLARDDFRRLFPTGGVLLFTDNATVHAWRRIQLASPVMSGDTVTEVNIALDRATPALTPATPPATLTLYALEGTVGVIDRGVQLEGSSPWTQ